MSALGILPTRAAMKTALTLPFAGIGGTGPYTYSVLAEGAGGSIDSSGIYTSPSSLSFDATAANDTIRVTDSVGAKIDATVMVATPLELICDIIQTGMGLDPGRVYLWDQKIFAPTDDGLFIAVGVIWEKPFANTRRFDPTLGDIQSINVHATLSIDVISRGPSARARKEEVLMAINSSYSQSQQELNSFSIYPLMTNFINLSKEDGAAIPYRFNISAAAQYFVTKNVSIPYYDTFQDVPVTTEP